MATVAPTEERVNSLLEAINTATAARDYADAQLCEAQQVSGDNDNYCMVWSTAMRGDFPPAQ